MEIQILIKEIDNQKIFLLVNNNITVLELKQRLQYEIGINQRGIRLIYQGHPIENDKILRSFIGLKDNSVIYLVRQMY